MTLKQVLLKIVSNTSRLNAPSNSIRTDGQIQSWSRQTYTTRNLEADKIQQVDIPNCAWTKSAILILIDFDQEVYSQVDVEQYPLPKKSVCSTAYVTASSSAKSI